MTDLPSTNDDHLARTIEKITKLRKLAESAAAIGNVHEANAAAEQAARLVARYQLDEAELQAAGQGAEPEVAELSPYPLFCEPKSTQWKSALAQALAEHHGVAIYRSRSGSTGEVSMRMVGRKSDIRLVRLFFAWLVSDFDVTSKIKSQGRGRTWVNNFLLGAVLGLHTSLKEARKSARDGVSEQALAIYDSRLDDANNALREMLPNLKTAKRTSGEIDFEARYAGQQYGEQAAAGLGRKAIK
jgi:hypothetical protein